MKKDTIQQIINKLVEFRDERDWAVFHKPKDLSLALSIESSELLECFLWKKDEEANKEHIREELADVFAYAFLLLHHYDWDLEDIMNAKIALNAEKYPVSTSKGNAKKYTDL